MAAVAGLVGAPLAPEGGPDEGNASPFAPPGALSSLTAVSSAFFSSPTLPVFIARRTSRSRSAGSSRFGFGGGGAVGFGMTAPQ